MTSNRRRQKSLTKPIQNVCSSPSAATGRKGNRNLSDMPSWFLLTFGAVSFLLFAWIASVVYKVTPEAVAVGNSHSFGEWGWKGFSTFALLGMLSIPMWAGWTVAARCQAIIVERHLK